MPRLPRPLRRAFTLIELIVVLGLVSVILLLAAPQMTEMIGMQRSGCINLSFRDRQIDGCGEVVRDLFVRLTGIEGNRPSIRPGRTVRVELKPDNVIAVSNRELIAVGHASGNTNGR